MKILVSGFMGSGKSYITQQINKLFPEEFEIINADKIVSELYQENKELIQKINNEFGLKEDIISKDDLNKLIKENFINLFTLENIVRPYLEFEIKNKIDENKEIIYLVECYSNIFSEIKFDYEIIAFSRKEKILERLQKRDKRSIEDVEKILKKQEMEFNKITKVPTYVINTEEAEDKLKQEIENIKVRIDDKDWENS